MPDQAVADKEGRAVREISLAVIDDQALSFETTNMMSTAVAVVGFLFPFEGDCNAVEDRFPVLGAGFQVLLLEPLSEVLQFGFNIIQEHPVRAVQRSHIGQMELSIQIPAEIRLGEPTIKGNR